MIKSIEIEIGEATVKVTPDQLRALFDALSEHFKETKEVHHYHPGWYWVYPNYPLGTGVSVTGRNATISGIYVANDTTNSEIKCSGNTFNTLQAAFDTLEQAPTGTKLVIQ